MPRLRICVLTAAYPSPSEPTRAVFLRNFLEALAREGAELTVVAPRIRREDPALEVQGSIRVERFSYPAGNRRLKEMEKVPATVLGFYVASALWTFLRVIHRESPELVYAHWVLPAGFVAALASSLTGLPLVIHAHGSDIHRFGIQSRSALGVARWSLKKASLVLAVSRDLRERMAVVETFGVPPERIQVVAMGVDGDLFVPGDRKEARRALSLEDERLQILYVGDLDAGKGILPVARSLLGAEDLASRIRLHLVGDGPLRPDLEALRMSAGESLAMHGRLAQEKVALWCCAADVLILPSSGEGSPLAVMEALASGLPVVATPVGGIPDLLEDGRTGWLATVDAFPVRVREIVEHREKLDAARQRILEVGADWTATGRARAALNCLAEVVSRLHHEGGTGTKSARDASGIPVPEEPVEQQTKRRAS